MDRPVVTRVHLSDCACIAGSGPVALPLLERGKEAERGSDAPRSRIPRPRGAAGDRGAVLFASNTRPSPATRALRRDCSVVSVLELVSSQKMTEGYAWIR